MLWRQSRKAQTGGMVSLIVFGVVAIIIGVIIAFVVVSTVNNANLLESNRITKTVTNERNAFINSTGYSLAQVDSTHTGYLMVRATNATSGALITAANYSLSTAGLLTNDSTVAWPNVTINYTYVVLTPEEISTDKVSGNFTDGVDNVSAKIPTIFLIAAIILILSVLAILVAAWQRLKLGGTFSSGI